MSWKPETESLDDTQLIDPNFMKASTVKNLGDADFEVVIGRNTGVYFSSKEEYYEDEIDDRSINEMCTVYGEIFYEMKEFISATGMPFLSKNSDWYVMKDFFTYMDDSYGN
jgi:hypothetical protein